MHYHFKIHKEKNHLWAECIELEGCVTQGDNIEHLNCMMEEALNLHLDEPLGSDILLPLPDSEISGKNIVKVHVDPCIAFALAVKHLRHNKKITQQQFAEMLNMKNIYSYQRLEKKANPKLETLAKIKNIFPEFSVDELL